MQAGRRLNRYYTASGGTHAHQGSFLAIRKWPGHEGKEEEAEEEEKERIVVHNPSRNCAFSGDWNICWSCVSVGGPLLAPTRVVCVADGPSTCFWTSRASGGSRYETNTARHVFDCAEPPVLAHRKPARETSAQRLTMTGENSAGTKERKNSVHQPLMHL